MLKAWIGGAAMAVVAIAVAGEAKVAAERTAYDFTMQAIDGKPLPFSKFKGKVMLVVNTASKCGFTPQYEGLEKLHQTYASQGFTVLGVPSGDFKEQEFASNKEIAAFCKTKFGIQFPLTEKSHVVGNDAAPFYQWAATTLGEEKTPKWNFHKYLVGRDGKLIAAFGTKTDPNAPEVRAAIEQALAAKPA